METEKNPITTKLAKENVTDVVIAKLKTDFLPLKINGINDKEGYDKVHKARIQCRDIRVLAEKICKKGREDAVKEQKAWIAKEKEVVAQVSEVETYLKKQEDVIDQEKENIRIRAERLLKLPGRKEQLIGLEKYFEKDALDDEYIMTFTDEQWLKVVLLAKEKKLNEQQKEIDYAKELSRMNLIADRENALYKIAGATMQIRHGVKTFFKGDKSITEEEIATLENEAWNIRFGEITTAQGETKVPEIKGSVSVHHFDNPVISEISDEEKLFNFASSIENLSRPLMKTKVGQSILTLAEDLLTQTINLLRQ